MKNFKIMNINLNENYFLGKVSVNDLKDLILDVNPTAISIQNANYITRKKLDEKLSQEYNFYDTFNKNVSQSMLINKEQQVLYDKYISLNDDIYSQLKNTFDTTRPYNCQSLVTGVDNKYTSLINATIDKTINSNIKSKSTYQLFQLENLIELYQNKMSTYGTDMQIVMGDFERYDRIEEICLKHDLCDLSSDLSDSSHILVSNNIEVTDIDVRKVKTKSFRNNYASIVSLQTK